MGPLKYLGTTVPMDGGIRGNKSPNAKPPALLDVVALLRDLPAHGLARGQVGTVLEGLDDRTWLVEFSDDQGKAYALVACSSQELQVLHDVPEAA